MAESNFFGKDGFIWWKGVVEDRKDPLFLGRVKVRIFGWHTQNKEEMPTEKLPWSLPSLPIDNGKSPVGLKEGDWVWGFFMDGEEAQKPIVVGFVPGISEDKADPKKGYYDPTPDAELTAELQPRPPDMVPVPESEKDGTGTSGGRFSDPNRLPGSNVAFGVLVKDYDAKNYKWDMDADGDYDQDDANKLIDTNNDGIIGNEEEFFNGFGSAKGGVPISRYPLEKSMFSPAIGEPITSRLARNENTTQTIVTLKKQDLSCGEGAGHESSAVGTDEAAEPYPFIEPETPYDAKYPFNHVYESESGHVTEIDDTPGKQRLHWYHRAGTFKEMHPDGTQVDKIKKWQYHFVIEDYCFWTGKTANFHATEGLRFKGGQLINMEADNLNRNATVDMNALVGRNINTRAQENIFTLVEKESWTHVIEGTYLYVKEGVLHIVADKNILIQSDKDVIQLESPVSISLSAPIINLQGPAGAQAIINLRSVQINADYLKAHKAGIAFPGVGDTPDPTTPIPPFENKAREEFYEDKPEETSKFKPGFELPEPAPYDDTWKPIADGSPKTLRTLSFTSPNQSIYEALPTGELEAVYLNYWNDVGQITTWEIVRPKHVPGRLIEKGTFKGIFEDGRYICKWEKKGGDYPKQVFWVVEGQKEPHLIQDSAIRHETFREGGFDNKIKGFDFNKTRDPLPNEKPIHILPVPEPIVPVTAAQTEQYQLDYKKQLKLIAEGKRPQLSDAEKVMYQQMGVKLDAPVSTPKITAAGVIMGEPVSVISAKDQYIKEIKLAAVGARPPLTAGEKAMYRELGASVEKDEELWSSKYEIEIINFASTGPHTTKTWQKKYDEQLKLIDAKKRNPMTFAEKIMYQTFGVVISGAPGIKTEAEKAQEEYIEQLRLAALGQREILSIDEKKRYMARGATIDPDELWTGKYENEIIQYAATGTHTVTAWQKKYEEQLKLIEKKLRPKMSFAEKTMYQVFGVTLKKE